MMKENLNIISDDYKKQVVNRIKPNTNKYYPLIYSSCLWLKENNVIDQNDIDEFEKIRNHRNLIAHNPVKLLVDDNTNINIELLKKSQELLAKIEKWWIVEFESTVNPDFNGQEIDNENASSGTTIFLDYLMEIANEEINKS